MELKITKKILFEIIEHLKEAVYIVDAQGKVVYLNDAASELEQMPKKDFLGKTIADVYFNTEFHSHKNSPCLDVLASGEVQENENLEWYTADGTTINAITNTFPIMENGEILGVFSMAENIADLKKRLIEIGAFPRKQTYRMKKKTLHNGTSYIFDDIIGESDALQSTITIARRFAAKKLPVMIYGETGTGKEMFAQSIHNASSSVAGHFIPVNCAAIPENLLESILFGTVKGAFTGAIDSVGLLEKAENGSVFLDEINSMPIGLQAKILRALQEKEVQRIGDSKTRKINCRIISATNKLPAEAIRDGEMREDLFYRLSTGMILIPPLRERGNDFELLADYFIAKCNEEIDATVTAMSPELKNLLKTYYFPGNIRELANIIESAMNMTIEGENILDLRHLPTYLKNHFKEEISAMPNAEQVFQRHSPQSHKNVPQMDFHGNLNTMMAEYEKGLIELALASTQGNLTKCGEKLGITRQNLTFKMKRHNIDLKKFKRR